MQNLVDMSRASFSYVSLDNRAGVEKKDNHDQRRSRMIISEIGSPSIWIG